MWFSEVEAGGSDGDKGGGDGIDSYFNDVKEGLDHDPALAPDLRVDVAEMSNVLCVVCLERVERSCIASCHTTRMPSTPTCRALKTSTPMIRTGIQAVRTSLSRCSHLTTAPSPSALKTRPSSPRSSIRQNTGHVSSTLALLLTLS